MTSDYYYILLLLLSLLLLLLLSLLLILLLLVLLLLLLLHFCLLCIIIVYDDVNNIVTRTLPATYVYGIYRHAHSARHVRIWDLSSRAKLWNDSMRFRIIV